jgi:hypothetical protein
VYTYLWTEGVGIITYVSPEIRIGSSKENPDGADAAAAVPLAARSLYEYSPVHK